MEYFDIVDEKGNPTGSIVERSIAHTYGIRHRTAHVWLTRMHEGSPQLLLQKRCREKDSFPGCYDISSAGHIPAGVDYLDSAVRELEEELGVSVPKETLIFCGVSVISYSDEFHGHPFNDNQVSNVYLLRMDMDETDFVLQPEEIDSVIWMDYDTVLHNVENNLMPNCIILDELHMLKPFLFVY